MAPARSSLVAIVSALIALSVPLATGAAAVTPTNWKFAVGWNGTTLPASTFGKSIGAFTPPASASASAAFQNLASTTADLGTPGGVFICTDLDWQGQCGYAVQPLNECIVLVSPWLDAISSFGPDPGATCFAFSSGNCDTDDAEWSFMFPGDDTGGLATTDPWNDKASLRLRLASGAARCAYPRSLLF
ncbi:hypothetical protein DFH07DRAFT_1063818 [Mycena maculata]|uniref:Uncharacterized protein n=1 Tax=Mycena maculata TaxID=230809 RepID=A0AAD7IG22_9AGAR|nr:hypothetical protein DFH07DRAFT_1063818 [Mycena maculata]